MPSTDISDTQPRRPAPLPKPPDNKVSNQRISLKRIPWKWILLFGAVFVTVTATAAWMGWSSARRSQMSRQVSETNLTLDEQYTLGIQDLSEGRYDVAVQRFEYILAQNPGYPGATDRLVEAMEVLYSTATPTPQASTATPTPTPDPRPVQELFQSALQLVRSEDWTSAIDTLLSLRKADRSFMTARADGLLYLSLLNRGVQKIYLERNLQGGTYDLALAERFGPIDAEANTARNLARLYLYGVSFWEVDWAKAVEYFSQVASAMPNLTDSSGFTAAERYRISLINYGDQLASQEDWCNAQAQYEQAQALRAEPDLEEKLKTVSLMCLGPSETPTITGETPTPSITSTGMQPSATSTLSQVITPSSTPGIESPSPTTPVATQQPTQAPTATQPDTTPYPAPAAHEPNLQNPATVGFLGMTFGCSWALLSIFQRRQDG